MPRGFLDPCQEFAKNKEINPKKVANQSVINLVIIIACPAISKGIFFKDSKLNMVNSVVTIPPGSIDKPPINPEVV